MINPVIVNCEYTKFIGLKTKIRASLNGSKDMSQIPLLWQQVRTLTAQHPAIISNSRFVVITDDINPPLAESYYYALVAVSSFQNIPETLITYELPKKRIAKFSLKGPPTSIGQIAMRALKEWLPNSNESITENLELIIYPENYDRNDPNSPFEFCVFI